MDSASSKHLPIELIVYVLIFAAEACCGDPSRRAWLARLAIVCRVAHQSINAQLYRIIEISDMNSARLLHSTLLQRSDLARFVHALHLSNSIVTSVAEEPDVYLARQIAALCTPQLVQSAPSIFRWPANPTQDHQFGLCPLPVPNYLSIICEPENGPRFIPAAVYGATHLHLGMHERTSIRHVMMTLGIAAYHARTDATSDAPWGITHLAIDFSYDLEAMDMMRPILKELIRDDGSRIPIQRIVLRTPDTPAHWPIFLLGNIGFLGDKRIAVHKVPHSQTAELRDAQYAQAVDGWRMHATGVEDLWLSGETVHWEEI